MASGKFKFNTIFRKKINKIRKIPGNLIKLTQKNLSLKADEIKKDFKQGIKTDSLGLARLKPETIKRKEAKGFPRPTFPLYGKGPGAQRSYMNMLLKKKIKGGYIVKPSTLKHWEANLSLKELLEIHESNRPALEIVFNRQQKKTKKRTIRINNNFEIKVTKK